MSDNRITDMEQDDNTDEEYEEDEDDYEDGDDDMEDYEPEEADELIPSETTSPPISSPIADGFVDGAGDGDGDGGKTETNRGEIDVCPICFEVWTSGGDHRICCLPCGHIYGMSCIRKWLLWCQNGGKCPQCKSLYTLKDIRLLYASRLCIADEKPHEESAANFPYTREGFGGFQQYVSSCMEALHQRMDALERRAEELDSQVHNLQERYNEVMGQTRENSQ